MLKFFMKIADDIEVDDRYIYIAEDGKILRLTASEVMDATVEIPTASFIKECGDKTKATELIKNYLDKR